MIPMSPDIFCSHYAPKTSPPATHLCYEVYDGKILIASDHLTNGERNHAEGIFMWERFRDEWRNCSVVWYISWSPCDHCMQILLNSFLPRNPHVKLHIFFAKVYKLTSSENIKKLHQRGVQIRVMNHNDFHWCWNHYVEAGTPFKPWWNLQENYQKASSWLYGTALTPHWLLHTLYWPPLDKSFQGGRLGTVALPPIIEGGYHFMAGDRGRCKSWPGNARVLTGDHQSSDFRRCWDHYIKAGTPLVLWWNLDPNYQQVFSMLYNATLVQHRLLQTLGRPPYHDQFGGAVPPPISKAVCFFRTKSTHTLQTKARK